MFKSIHDEVNTRIRKVEGQLNLLQKVETDPKLVYTEFKEYMVKPNSLYLDLLTSIPRAFGSHEIQQWIMKLSNVYLQEWIEETYPEYKDKIFVSHHNYSTFPSKFRIHFQESEYKNVIHTGQKEICRFDIYEKSYLNALRYKTIEKYEEFVESELQHLNARIKESKENLEKWESYQKNPTNLIKNLKEFIVYTKGRKKIKNNIDNLVERYRREYEDSEKSLSDFITKSIEDKEHYVKCTEVINIVSHFFNELSYELVESDNYY